MKSNRSHIFRKKHKAPRLFPLTSINAGDENKYYVEMLNSSIANKDHKNIALMGGFSSGKSSILKQFVDSLGIRYWKKTKYISCMPAVDEKATSANEQERIEDRLQVQKEMLKQLLYGETPNKLSRLRYFRTNKKVGIKGCVISGILALIGTVYAERLVGLVIDDDIFWKSIVCSLIFVLSYVLIKTLLSLVYVFFHDNPIKAIKLDSLEFGLSNDGKPDFDQFLDEIIYYFEVTKCRIVILEDLDRFEDPLIFEDLKRLNAIINGSSQVGQKVTFIYAIGDKVFRDSSERVKFFDDIVHVVPVMSYSNAADHIAKKLEKLNYKPSDFQKTTAILVRRVHDMRVLNDIFNVFETFGEIILNKDLDWLEPEKLLALSILKIHCPDEYDKIRSRNSLLDKMFDACNNYSGEQLAIENKKLSDLNALDQLIEPLNGLIIQKIYDTIPNVNSYGITITLGDDQITTEDLGTKDFINKLIAGNVLSLNRANYQIYDESYTLSELEELVDGLPYVVSLMQDSVGEINSRIKDLSDQNKFVLIDEVIDSSDGLREELLNESCVVMYDILKNGLLDDSYYLYTSRFMGLVQSKTVINFERNYLRGQKSEYTVNLSDSEVERILEPLDKVDLINPALYNYSIFDFLLKNNDVRLETILHPEEEQVSQLISFMNSYNIERFKDVPGERERTVIKGRISESDNAGIILTKKISTVYPAETLAGIINSDKYPGYDRYIAIISAIISMEKPESIKLGEDVLRTINVLELELADLANRNNCQLSFAQLLVNNDVIIGDLSSYENKEAFKYIVDKKSFIVNVDNLSLISEEQAISVLNESSLSEMQVGEIVDSSKIAKSIKICLLSGLNVIVGKISNRDIAEKIQKFMKRNSMKITREQFYVLADAFDIAGIIGLLLDSDFSAHDMAKVLSEMSFPYNKLSEAGSRPRLNNDTLNDQLIGRLKNIGIVNSSKLVENDTKIQANVSRADFLVDSEDDEEVE